jgi:hypothetical protein
MQSFPGLSPEGAVHAVPSRTIKDLVARLQAGVTTVEYRAEHCRLPSNGRRLLQVSMRRPRLIC